MGSPGPALGAPRVSVILPVYNAMPYLPAAVASLLSQMFRDFELIALDDASSDGSADFLRGIDDDRLILLTSDHNVGHTRRIQQGVDLARGELIARHDADDLSLPSRFERQVREFDRNPALALVCSSFDTIDEHNAVTGLTQVPQSATELREALLWTNPIAHGSVMMRRTALARAGGYDAAFEPAEDLELWNRLAAQGALLGLADVLYRLRVYSASVTGSRRVAQRRMAHRARLAARQRYQPAQLSARSLALHHYVLALHELSEGDPQRARIDLREAAAFPGLFGPDTEILVREAVSLAVELGPSGRQLVMTAADATAGEQFIHLLIQSMPPALARCTAAALLAEYHATCAYLFAHRGVSPLAMRHLTQSWLAGPRHRGNRGLVKTVLGAGRPGAGRGGC